MPQTSYHLFTTNVDKCLSKEEMFLLITNISAFYFFHRADIFYILKVMWLEISHIYMFGNYGVLNIFVSSSLN